MARNRVTGPGGHNVICDVCGLKYKAQELRRRWDGAMVCEWDFEPRHPQEFVRAKRDNPVLPFIRPDLDDSIIFAGTLGLINDLGNGTLTATYTSRQDSTSNTVITAVINLTIGDTTTFNAGVWTVTVPITNGGQAATGHAELLAKNRLYRGTVNLAASASTATITDIETNVDWTDTVPQTFSDDDTLLITIRYGTAL